jgi:hypothetical protein
VQLPQATIIALSASPYLIEYKAQSKNHLADNVLNYLGSPMFQSTIQRPVETEGVGLHTGVHTKLRLHPAPPDTGIVFRRVDLDNFPIEAHGHNVARVSYATSLMKQGVLLSTTEHLLAAA